MNHFNLPVEEFTTPSPVTAAEDDSVERIEDLMRIYDIHHIPIVRDGRVTGIISDRDLRVAISLTILEKILISASDIMVNNPVTVSAGEPLGDVAFEMAQNKIGSVIVNDENDKFLGIFTLTDALNALIEITRTAQIDEQELNNTFF